MRPGETGLIVWAISESCFYMGAAEYINISGAAFSDMQTGIPQYCRPELKKKKKAIASNPWYPSFALRPITRGRG
jgi:hypothetical protein